MYAGGGEMTANIDRYGGEGNVFCKSEKENCLSPANGADCKSTPPTGDQYRKYDVLGYYTEEESLSNMF